MGTVGLDFGSATSGKGFDVVATVTSILGIQQAIETPWKTQITALQAQDVVFTTIGTDLSALTTSLRALTDFTGVMAQKQGSSSDTSLLSLTSASATSVAGSHTVVVNSLAQTSSKYSDTVAVATDSIAGSLTFQVGSAAGQTIAAKDGDSLTTFASAINSAGLGVTASVISDVNGSRLSVVSNTGGGGGELKITSSLSDATTGASLGFHTGQSGLDASLTVDGIALSSATNKVSTAIPGVTFQLLSASPGKAIQVEIANDNSAISSAFTALVTAYNAVAKDIKGQEGKDATGKAQPLYGSPTLALIQTQLASALLGGVASGAVNSVSQMGIVLNQDGTLKLDGDALNQGLDAHFTDIVGFLQNAESFGQTFASSLNTLGSDSTQGAVYLVKQQNTAQEAALNKSVTDQDARLTDQKKSLTKELSLANQILQSIPSQLDQFNQLYSAITGYK